MRIFIEILRSACKSNDFLTARFSTLLERSVYIIPKIVRNYQPMDKLLENIDNCKWIERKVKHATN